MFNYKKFKEEIKNRGYKCYKNGKYITIKVNKGGFCCFTDVFDPDLHYTNETHQFRMIRSEFCNDYIYEIVLRIEG